MRVNGEIEGMKNTILAELDALYDLNIPKDMLWTEELISKMSLISGQIKREIAVYVDRKGKITDVSVGDNKTVSLSHVEGKRNSSRLSGITCIHTHPNSSGMLSSVDISSLKLLRLDAMIAIGLQHGLPQEIFIGVISETNPEKVDILGPFSYKKKNFETLIERIAVTDKKLRQSINDNQTQQERTILVGLQTRESRDLNGVSEAEVSLKELEELANTAGAIVVGSLMQKRDTRRSSTVIGQGKIEELKLLAQSLEADIVIFDEELTGAQQRNIEKAVGLKVLSRTSLILDIFAQRARSREGKLQVELAQLEYNLPRLMGMGQALSRLGGGIGTRGPGETKLETDRRAIRARITHLKEQLSDIRKQRGVLRSDRKKSGIPVVSLVGYTNAGKSTLLNTLCEADVFAEDKLFATLDTTTRKLILEDGITVLLTDTVGFIRRLPHNLLDAFKSTLEEVVLSDLILLVADMSDPHVDDHINIVDEILGELGANSKPTIIVLNKIDAVTEKSTLALLPQDRKIAEVSAKQGIGLNELKQMIKSELYKNRVVVDLAIPITDGAPLAWLYANGKVINVVHEAMANKVTVEIDNSLLPKINNFIIS